MHFPLSNNWIEVWKAHLQQQQNISTGDRYVVGFLLFLEYCELSLPAAMLQVCCSSFWRCVVQQVLLWCSRVQAVTAPLTTNVKTDTMFCAPPGKLRQQHRLGYEKGTLLKTYALPDKQIVHDNP